ncbi:hypothetical protein [Fusobacterium necrophorum]|uniref:hypothetical protein n=1 Tax=Fusobacterium necrophorum TaxID=859 RepID=UPI00254A3BBF|nr:hypothetical protein [Fusobacterium necrophorum]MDK4523138.1 hypothetical protein [Fusobacterium necrophorum]
MIFGQIQLCPKGELNMKNKSFDEKTKTVFFEDGWSLQLTENEWNDFISGNMEYWGIALN